MKLFMRNLLWFRAYETSVISKCWSSTPLQSWALQDTSDMSALPPLPKILIFVFWSAVFHLTLLMLLDDWLPQGVPGNRVIITVRLASQVPMMEPVMLPDFSTELLRQIEFSLETWGKEAPMPEMRHEQTFSDNMLHPDESTHSPAAEDYYHKSGELDEQPVPLEAVVPMYPEEAKAMGLDGYAKLLLLIDEEGRLRGVDILESSPPGVFGDAAAAAFRNVKFTPGVIDALPVKSRMIIKVEFKAGMSGPALPQMN